MGLQFVSPNLFGEFRLDSGKREIVTRDTKGKRKEARGNHRGPFCSVCQLRAQISRAGLRVRMPI
jgi:hypothetical protein